MIAEGNVSKLNWNGS